MPCTATLHAVAAIGIDMGQEHTSRGWVGRVREATLEREIAYVGWLINFPDGRTIGTFETRDEALRYVKMSGRY